MFAFWSFFLYYLLDNTIFIKDGQNDVLNTLARQFGFETFKQWVQKAACDYLQLEAKQCGIHQDDIEGIPHLAVFIIWAEAERKYTMPLPILLDEYHYKKSSNASQEIFPDIRAMWAVLTLCRDQTIGHIASPRAAALRAQARMGYARICAIGLGADILAPEQWRWFFDVKEEVEVSWQEDGDELMQEMQECQPVGRQCLPPLPVACSMTKGPPKIQVCEVPEGYRPQRYPPTATMLQPGYDSGDWLLGRIVFYNLNMCGMRMAIIDERVQEVNATHSAGNFWLSIPGLNGEDDEESSVLVTLRQSTYRNSTQELKSCDDGWMLLCVVDE